MMIRSHSESHIVELEDGSRWQIFPGDLDVTLDWTPEVDLMVLEVDDDIGSHVLISHSGRVRVIRVGESWRVQEARSILRDS